MSHVISNCNFIHSFIVLNPLKSISMRCSSSPRLFSLSLRRLSGGPESKFDVAVIGGGPGGYVAAIKAAQLGLRVACVEKRNTLGGTCLNVGCIPSKALLYSSHLFEDASHNMRKYGVVADKVTLDLEAMMKQKDASVAALTRGIAGLFKKNKVEHLQGFGRISGEKQVTVDLTAGGQQVITADHVVVATGSEPTSVPGLVIDEQRVVSSTGALALKTVPKKLLVVGAGVIGLELGSVWARLGAEVTVVEFLDRITPSVDGEIATAFKRVLEKQSEC